MDGELLQLSRLLGAALERRGWQLSTAESCTGGWISAAVTATAGSSNWFDRGFVTYSNAAKIEMLGVSARTLEEAGAVSAATASEMARGALAHSRAALAIAVSGIAGPGGGTAEKPVGTVCIAWACSDGRSRAFRLQLDGGREAVRRQTVVQALRELIAAAA